MELIIVHLADRNVWYLDRRLIGYEFPGTFLSPPSMLMHNITRIVHASRGRRSICTIERSFR